MLPQATQLYQLHRAWTAQPQPDAWLRPLLIDQRGIDWPLLRRHLIAWAAAQPAGQILAIPMLYPALCTAFGPLGDQHTHGFRSVDRAPLATTPCAGDLGGDTAWAAGLAGDGDGTGRVRVEVWSWSDGERWELWGADSPPPPSSFASADILIYWISL